MIHLQGIEEAETRRRKARRNNLRKRPTGVEYGEVESPDASMVEYAVIV